MDQDFLAKVDTNWFYEAKDYYLNTDLFKSFEELSRVKLGDLTSTDSRTRKNAQEKLVSQSKLLNELRKEHSGYGMPMLVYTHALDLAASINDHNPKLDKLILSLDMTDSLRRRHIALSHAIIPWVLKNLAEDFGGPLIVNNLGSGVGLDTIQAARKFSDRKVIITNYDTNNRPLRLGEKIIEYLKHQNILNGHEINFKRRSLVRFSETPHLCILVGVICGLTDNAARSVLHVVYKRLRRKGRIIVSSSNFRMLKDCPLASFLIQHIGSPQDPFSGWGLNCRNKDKMYYLLKEQGFSNVMIFDDVNYPEKDKIPVGILWGVDSLPSKALGLENSRSPLALPPEVKSNSCKAYNWIAIATKP